MDIREHIVNRLHERCGMCTYCGKRNCLHGSNTILPSRLDLNDVLWAINLDGYFDKDDVNNIEACCEALENGQ